MTSNSDSTAQGSGTAHQPRRVCIVMGAHWAVQIGGAQYQVQCLVEQLGARSGIETFVLARKIPEDPTDGRYRLIRIGFGTRRGPHLLLDLPRLYRALRRVRPDVIYQRGLKSYTGVCALYCIRHRSRLVFHVAHDDDVRPPRRRKGRGLGAIVRRLERWVAEYGLRRSGTIVVQTRDQARMLERYFGRSADVVVRNFHPLPQELEPHVDDGKFRVIWVANFKRDKNPELFVDLAEAFSGRRDIEFVMIGRPGSRQTYEALHERIARSRNLRFLGELPIETVNAELARSDVFVNTSSAEGFPNTFVQAWLRGIAVVSCYVDPDQCLTVDGAGILAGDPQRLFSVIGALADDRVRTRALGRAGREHALRHHGLQGAMALVELLAGRCDARSSETSP